jgi:hemerythrin superfamily protein
MTNDPITIIKDDHELVEELFSEYEELEEDDADERRRIADEIIARLTTHAEMEETLCYPKFRDALADTEDNALIEEAYAEHTSVKDLLNNLETLDAATPEFEGKMNVLSEQVRHHVKEEEGELLPKIEEVMSADALTALGEEMLAFKESATA